MSGWSNAALKVSKQQIKIIYALGNGLGLVDRMADTDMLHELVYSVSKKDHISSLTSLEADQVIACLKNSMKGKALSPSTKSKERRGMASEAQKSKIKAQMHELVRLDSDDGKGSCEKRLRGFLRKYAQVDDINFLTAAQAWKIIEGLKAVIAKVKN